MILDDDAKQKRFDALQASLLDQWRAIGSLPSPLEQGMVCVPSLSIDYNLPGSVLQSYEERFLFLLLLLRKPRMRIVYVTSQPVLPAVIDYYLGLLPGVISGHARKRLFEVAALDTSSRPLSAKLLERPRLLERIRSLIDPRTTHLVPYNTTDLERELALRLGIPMYGADPKFFPLGTKSGSRRLFREEGVAHPIGIENIHTLGELVDAIRDLRARRPVHQVLVKLDEGVSGAGNALIELSGLAGPGSPGEAAAVETRVRAMRCEASWETYDTFMDQLAKKGGIVEERIHGRDLRSPSAQMRITPRGVVELLSTHDQVLGGPSGQSYLGCRFPADSEYAPAIMREAAKVGRRLAREGVLGRFAVDFIAVRGDDGAWHCYAIEINLRKGGTTHPFLTLQFLTTGRYDAEAGAFVTPAGDRKCYVASDHVESPVYRALSPEDLFDIAVRYGLHFNHTTQTGVVFHMLASLSERGHIGMTVIHDSPGEVDALHARVLEVLDREAAQAAADQGYPQALEV